MQLRKWNVDTISKIKFQIALRLRTNASFKNHLGYILCLYLFSGDAKRGVIF